MMARAFTWKLWGAAYVIHGGSRRDGFVYFRHWLIFRGRHVYEAAIKDPDVLADLIPADAFETLEDEELASIPAEVWSRKTGQDPLANL